MPEVQVRPLAAIAGELPSPVEAVHRAHAHAVDRLRGLELELEAAFLALHIARQEMKERADVDAIVSFTEPMTCAFERWHATYAAREMSTAPEAPESLDARREAEALAVANAGRDS